MRTTLHRLVSLIPTTFNFRCRASLFAVVIALLSSFAQNSDAAGYADAVRADGPIAYWRFSDAPPTAINSGSLGATADGTYNGGAAPGAQAPRPPTFLGFEPGNTAVQLDGTGGFVGTLGSLLNSAPVFTVSGWIRRNGDQAARTGLWGQNDLVEFGYIANQTLEVWTDNGLDIGNSIPNGEWAHLAIVSDGSPGNMSMYTNGVLAGTRAHTLPANNAFAFNIGGGGVFDGTGNFFNGQIDEVAIYTNALSAAQIAAQYGAAFTPIGSLPNVINIGQNKVGSVTNEGNENYTIVGGGNDIWDQRDEFTYAYTEVTGDFDVQVRVASLTASANWPKAGIMARESLSEFSRMAFARVTSDQPPGVNDVHFAYRTGLDNVAGVNGGQHEDGGGNPSGIPNAWLRLARIGNTMYMSNSADGIAWNLVSSQDTTAWGGGALSNKLFVGLGVSRHPSATTPTATAQFRSFQFNSNAAPFAVVGAESRGNPNGVRVLFNNPVGEGAYTAANYILTASGGPNVTPAVTGVRFTTANDATERDPLTFTLEGAMSPAGPWAPIASGDTGLLPITARNTVGPIVNFANAAPWSSYRVLFPTVRDAAAANSMQIAEVELLDALGNDVTAPGDPVIPTSANSPGAEQSPNAIDNSPGTKYLNFDKLNTGFIVTPAAGAPPPNPMVITASGGPNANTVQLVTSALVEGGVYELLVDSGVLASDGTSLASAIAVFTHGAGYEARRIHVTHNKTDDHGYYRLSDAVANGIGDVTTMEPGAPVPFYPPVQGNTVFEDPIPDLGDPLGNERFSSRFSGVLAPPTTGNYTFYWSSDDNGTLYMSTDANPTNKREIAREPVWSGVRTWIGEAGGGGRVGVPSASGGPQANTSGALALTAGNRYYLEGIFSEGGGGNNGSAAWLPPGGAAVVNGGSPIPESAFAPSRLRNGNSYNTLGPVRVISPPASQTVLALLPVTFTVGLDGTPDYTYQWRRNGVAIPGATGRSYTLPAAQLTDDQAVFTVVAANEFSSATSAGAVLTVLVPTPPHLLSASPDATFTTVTVRFDNRLEVASAQNIANYTLTHAGGPVNIVSATRAANAKDVVLITALMPEDTLHTLVVRNIHDETGTTTIESNPTNTTFTTLLTVPGYVLKEYYQNWSGGAGSVDPFIAAYRAGTTPLTQRCLTPLFEQNTFDEYENYGGHIAGYFVPTVSGLHVFFFASDDYGRLFMSTDASPTNIREIAREPVWSGRRTWVGAAGGGGRGVPSASGGPQANISGPLDLVAGQRYYMEGFFTEGGGGDNMGVAVQPPGGVEPVNGDSPITGVNLAAVIQAGTLTIVTQPQARTVTENSLPVFSVVASNSSTLGFCGGAGFNYQWRVDGVDIPGANQASLTVGPVSQADSGKQYSVVVTTPGRSATSANALLTVVSDNVPPRLLSARTDGSLTKIYLTWSEFMDAGPAGEENNYIVLASDLTPIAVTDATLLNGAGSVVVLTLASPMTENGVYSLEAGYQVDLVGNQTVKVGNPTGDLDHGVVTSVYALVPVLFQAYNTGGGNAVLALTTHASYPSNPDLVVRIASMDSRIPYPTDAREGYGATMTTLFVPPTSGGYTFYLRSDDASELWLSTTSREADKVKIQEETGCCNAFSAHASASISLVGGQLYWMQLLYKEGTGGDFGQAAVKLSSDPTDPNTLTPIGGAYVASLSDPASASVTITQQPTSQVFSGTTTAFSLDFNANDGGFYVETPLAYDGPWHYEISTGSWREDGQGPEDSHPNTSLLNSPALTVKASGNVVLTFAHRYSREGGNWDGAQLRISVNGGPFTAVPNAAFTQNGYNGTVLPNSSSVLHGQEAFVNDSPGHGAGTMITSIADLGAFTVGDVIQVQFIAASDTNTRGTVPNWEITDVSSPSLDSFPGSTARTVTFTVGASAMNSQESDPARTYQWYRDDGAGFVAIPGATSRSYTLAPAPSDNGALFRATVSIPGANATSDAATLTVGTVVTLHITRSGTQITLSWTGALTLQEANTVTGPWGPSARVNGVPFTPPTTGNKFYRLVP